MLNSSGDSLSFSEDQTALRVRVFYHDKCFDGACSASLFTRFHRERITGDADYEYRGLQDGGNGPGGGPNGDA